MPRISNPTTCRQIRVKRAEQDCESSLINPHISTYMCPRASERVDEKQQKEMNPCLQQSVLLLFFLLLLYFEVLPLNSAVILHPSDSNSFDSLDPIPNNTTTTTSSTILQDVLKVIAKRYKWDLDTITLLDSDSNQSPQFGVALSYEFHVRVRNTHLLFKFSDEVDTSSRFPKASADFASFVDQLSSPAVIDSFKIQGPCELRVSNTLHHNLSLSLTMNTSYAGLKRILVGDGITVVVRRASGVSFLLTNLDLPVNKSVIIKRSKNPLWRIGHSSCNALQRVDIVGSATLSAYRTRNFDAYVESVRLSEETVELVSDKCHITHNFKNPKFSINSLYLQIQMLGKVLRKLLGETISQDGYLRYVKAKIKASNVIRFPLELARNISSNDTLHHKMAEWKTRPAIERLWFEVLARVDEDMLKPILIKKVKPFIIVDTSEWSDLLSNISFTKFPSILSPPEALTLDIKW